MQDFIDFVRKVNGEGDTSADNARTLHCIHVADNIHRYMGLKPLLL